MPYSPDKEDNKENPFSPSPDLPLREQFLYRFSALEEVVRSGFRRMDENFQRIQTEVHDRHIETNERINEVERDFNEKIAFKRTRIDGLVVEGRAARKELEDRLVALETWSKVVTARFAVLLAVITATYTLLAPFIRNLLGVPNG